MWSLLSHTISGVGPTLAQTAIVHNALKDWLQTFVNQHGSWAYFALFLVVFCETGLVVTPFLPGDSLLLAVGMVAREGGIDPLLICAILIVAALAGDNCNYFLGSRFGRRLFQNEKSKIFNRKALDRTHSFFEKYGGRTILIGRFIPIIRTFAPFVAGMGGMRYRLFILYSVVAAILWVFFFVTMGYTVSGSRWVQDHFTLVLFALIAISAIPAVFEGLKHYREAKREKKAEEEKAKLESEFAAP